MACKAFGLTIGIKKMVVIDQLCSTSKQIQGVKQSLPVHNFCYTPIQVNEINLNYVKSFTYLSSKMYSDTSFDDEIVNHLAETTNALGKLCHHL